MRFIFSVVTNITYTLFCASIQYLILYFYRLLFFPSLYLLSLSVVTLTLYNTVCFYVVCIILLVAFDADTFRSQNDMVLEGNKYGAGDSRNLVESASVLSPHSAPDSGDDAPNGADATVVGVVVYRSSHINALLTLLLCHASILFSGFIVFVVSLYECTRVNDSVLCHMAFGNHAANNAIGIAMLLLSVSILLPLLTQYKLNVGNSRVLHTHLPSFVMLFTSLAHVAIVSKMQFYSRTCPLLVSFSGSLYVVYCSIALHFVFRVADVAVGFCIRQAHQRHQRQHQYHHQHHHQQHIAPHHDSNPNAIQDDIYSTVFVLIANTVLLLANLAYAWSISMVFNAIQTLVIVIFILSMSHRIIKMPTIRYSKKVQ
jgi:hypothetical protein